MFIGRHARGYACVFVCIYADKHERVCMYICITLGVLLVGRSIPPPYKLTCVGDCGWGVYSILYPYLSEYIPFRDVWGWRGLFCIHPISRIVFTDKIYASPFGVMVVVGGPLHFHLHLNCVHSQIYASPLWGCGWL